MPIKPPKDYSAVYRERWLEDDVDAFLAWLSPNDVIRRQIARYVAASINSAHALAPGLWGLTRLDEIVRLNFGNMEALVWSPEALFLMVHLSVLQRECHVVLGSGATGVPDVDALIRHDYGPFKTVPDSRYIEIPSSDNAEQWASLFEIVKPAHMKHLQLASRSPINGKTRASHHPGLVDAIGRLVEEAIPQPAYQVARPTAQVGQ
jgi:hypothetical protein